MTFLQQAAYHRAALLFGLTTGDVVIAWADDIIAHDHENAAPFLDLSLIPPHDLSELRHALAAVEGRVRLWLAQFENAENQFFEESIC